MDGSMVDSLISVYENDPEMAEIVALFVAEMPDRIAELKQAVDDGDIELAHTIAHQLKGAAGGYGFERLGEIAAAAADALRKLEPSLSKTQHSALLAATSPLLLACGRVRLSTAQAAA